MTSTDNSGKAFYTVREAAEIMRVSTSLLYAAIREEAFPAVRLRSRYVIPSKAIDKLMDRATETGTVVDPAVVVAERRQARYLDRVAPNWA